MSSFRNRPPKLKSVWEAGERERGGDFRTNSARGCKFRTRSNCTGMHVLMQMYSSWKIVLRPRHTTQHSYTHKQDTHRHTFNIPRTHTNASHITAAQLECTIGGSTLLVAPTVPPRQRNTTLLHACTSLQGYGTTVRVCLMWCTTMHFSTCTLRLTLTLKCSLLIFVAGRTQILRQLLLLLVPLHRPDPTCPFQDSS
eukprot:COSAG02_NODE_1556_length_11948_cov_8.326441_4_plen_197_part_00